MNNWEIINLERKLTKNEYKQLFDSLLNDETITYKWKEPEIYGYLDKVILKLKYLSKSGKATLNWCQEQFKYQRILLLKDNKDKGENYNEILCDTRLPELTEDDPSFIVPTIGSNCHWVCEVVWDKVDIEKVKKYSYMEDISKYFYELCLTFIPKDEIARSVYEFYLKQYADYEANRITEIINDIGLNCDKYIKPAYREVKIENPSQGKSGVIDVIYLLVDDTYAINDYKFGRPHYYDGSKWDRIGIETEISEYFSLLQGTPFRVLDTETMIPMDDLVIEKGRVLYLKDWQNTYQFIKITPELLQREKDLENDIIYCVNSGEFRRRVTQYCMLYCGLQRICERARQWQDKWNKVKSTLSIEMFNL